MALGDARKCFTSIEPWYPALPNRKGPIWTASALASYRWLLCPQGLSALFMDLKVTWSSPHHQQVSQGIQEKNFPRGWEEGIWSGGSSPRSDFLVSAFKNWYISICWQGYLFFFFLSWVRIFDPHGFLFPRFFFSSDEEDQGNWKGFCLAWNIWGFAGGFFLPGNVNGKMCLLREALESSYMLAGTEFGSGFHELARLCFEMLMWDNCIFPSFNSCFSFKYFSWSKMINI